MTLEFLSQQITRRQLALGAAGVAALTFLPAGALTASAQESSDLSAMGYPELDVTVTDAGFEGVPESTAAGRYLLKVTNANSDKTGNVGAVAFLFANSGWHERRRFHGSLRRLRRWTCGGYPRRR